MPRCEMCGEWPDCPWKTDPEIMCGEFHPKMTNAMKIRSMTDEELAKWLNQMQTDAYNRGMLEDWIFGYPNNYDNWLDWLKEVAKDD